MNRFKFIVIGLALFPFLCIGQEQHISAVVLNHSGHPVEFVYGSLINSDSSVVSQAITDSLGRLELHAKQGHYTLHLELFSTLLLVKPINVNGHLNLGQLTIDESLSIESITISTNRKLFERKADRLVFNVENSVAASSGTGLDALRVTPGVKVQNDAISIVGKGQVAVLINDRPIILSGKDLSDFIKSLNANEIKSIEVMTNPPAKYQAEGNAGIINIRQKRIKSNSWSNTITTRYSQFLKGSAGANNVLNYSRRKLDMGANISYNDGFNTPEENNTINYPLQTWDEKYIREIHSRHFRTRGSVDYHLSDRLSMGAQYNFSRSAPKSIGNDVVILSNATAHTIDSILINTSDENIKNRLHTLNYHFVFKVDTVWGRTLNVDLDWIDFNSKNVRLFSNSNYLQAGDFIDGSFYQANNLGIQSVRNFSVNVDMVHPIGEYKLNYGARISFSNTQNNIEYYDLTSGTPTLDKGKTDSFTYYENIQALYFTVNKDFRERWKIQAGLRMEYTQTKGNSIITKQKNGSNYAQLFPTAYISYSINSDNVINFNYGRRLRRPVFRDLNPFQYYLSLYAYVEGNPLLKPSYNNNLEINYLFKEIFNLQFYYSYVEDGFGQVLFLDPEDLTKNLTRTENYYSSNIWGLNASYTFNSIKRWEALASFDFNYSTSQSNIPQTNQFLRGSNAFISLDNTITITKNIKLNVAYSYSFPGVDDLYKILSTNELNSTLRMDFLGKSITVAIAGYDLLRTNNYRAIGFSNNIRTVYNNYYDNQGFSIQFSYKFGNKSIRSTKYTDNIEINRL